MTATLPPLFTCRPGALLLDQWATRDGKPHRAQPRNTRLATADDWHTPPVALFDVADHLQLTGKYGLRPPGTYTIAVGATDADVLGLQYIGWHLEAHLWIQLAPLPQRVELCRLLDVLAAVAPDRLQAAVAGALTGGRRTGLQR